MSPALPGTCNHPAQFRPAGNLLPAHHPPSKDVDHAVHKQVMSHE